MVAIVPNIWVQNCSNMYFCFWLPQKCQVTKMIKSADLLDEETWLQYPCEILKTFGTYEEARSKLPKYDNNYDAESSNIENRGRGKRKKKPNTWKINSDSESDSYSMITMPEPTWIRSLDDFYNRTNKLKQSNNITTPDSQNQIRESKKSSTSLTTPVFKKVTSIFTTPVPQEYKNDNSISENNLTQMNLLVQDQLPTETNSDNCLSPPMFENDNESHNEDGLASFARRADAQETSRSAGAIFGHWCFRICWWKSTKIFQRRRVPVNVCFELGKSRIVRSYELVTDDCRWRRKRKQMIVDLRNGCEPFTYIGYR